MRALVLATLICGLGLRAQDKQIKKVPVEPIPMNSGQTMFKAYCAPCHGLRAKGDGPAAVALKKLPPDLTQLASKNNGKFPGGYVAAVLRSSDAAAHGSNEMPVWGPMLRSVSRDSGETQLRVNNIVSYIASLQAQ